jgi:hypothetical protein
MSEKADMLNIKMVEDTRWKLKLESSLIDIDKPHSTKTSTLDGIVDVSAANGMER